MNTFNWLTECPDTILFLTDKPFRPIAHENVLYPRADKCTDFNWMIQDNILTFYITENE